METRRLSAAGLSSDRENLNKPEIPTGGAPHTGPYMRRFLFYRAEKATHAVSLRSCSPLRRKGGLFRASEISGYSGFTQASFGAFLSVRSLFVSLLGPRKSRDLPGFTSATGTPWDAAAPAGRRRGPCCPPSAPANTSAGLPSAGPLASPPRPCEGRPISQHPPGLPPPVGLVSRRPG